MACARYSLQQLGVYTLDGNNHLGQITSAGFEISIQTQDGSSGASSDESATETKRSTSHNFTLKVDNGSGAPMTSAQIATLSIGGGTRIGIAKSYTMSVSNKAEDGSGIGNLDTCPVALKRKVSGQVREMVPYNIATPDLIDRANSNTPADRNVIVSCNFGAATLTYPAKLNKAGLSENDSTLTMVDASFEKNGAVTTPSSGTNIFAVAFIGDALVTVVHTLANDTDEVEYSAVGVITSLVVQVEDGQIVSATGTIDIQGPMTITEEALP